MKIIRKVEEMQETSFSTMVTGKKIGFVPTMGYFHEGHLKLMEQAKMENDIVIASVFVNPLQFGVNEDFEKYPRNEQKDIELAKNVGVDILFMPTIDEMYPKKARMIMKMIDRTDVLCGKSRPGHFDGVITVLSKLFHIIQPSQVYFGLKDAQQVAVVDALIHDLNFPITLVGIPTVREPNGLAKSSRNVYLDEREKAEAIWLYKALQKGQQLIVDGQTNPDMIIKEVTNTISEQTTGKIDYVELLSYPDLKPVATINQNVILATAVFFKHARLIDNLLLDLHGNQINSF